jgi:hypothetical protein
MPVGAILRLQTNSALGAHGHGCLSHCGPFASSGPPVLHSVDEIQTPVLARQYLGTMKRSEFPEQHEEQYLRCIWRTSREALRLTAEHREASNA